MEMVHLFIHGWKLEDVNGEFVITTSFEYRFSNTQTSPLYIVRITQMVYFYCDDYLFLYFKNCNLLIYCSAYIIGQSLLEISINNLLTILCCCLLAIVNRANKKGNLMKIKNLIMFAILFSFTLSAQGAALEENVKNSDISIQNNQHQINFKSLQVRVIKKGTHYIKLSIRDYDVGKPASDRRSVSDYLGGTIEVYSVLNEKPVSLIAKFEVDNIRITSSLTPVALGDSSVGCLAYIDDMLLGDYSIIFNLYNKTEQNIDYSVGFKRVQSSK
ncbi:hypothetical protein RHO13_08420 [Orbus wheelerorum]|uniref:hypothetical protein n=1 Tax=Orbus wheelerorum TaxID=3074111 RepID=UPI00370D7AC4